MSGILTWLSTHRTVVTTALLGAGLLVLVVLLLARLVKRAGGGAVVRRRIGREITLTVRAFIDPVRRWLHYRRRLRHLVRLLGDARGWRDAERALDVARTSGAHPYAVLLGHATVGVLVASGPDPVPPPGAWRADEDDPRLWWCPRARLGDRAGLAAPVLTAVGLDDAGDEPFAVLLDLCAGPASLVLGGDPVIARVLQRSVAAQLDMRLPGGVVVGEGVHPRHSGPSASEAWSAVRARAASGRLTFAVTAGAPATHPADGRARLIVTGTGHGHTWQVTADRLGTATLAGTPLAWDVLALAPAVARTLGHLPPILAPDGDGTAPEAVDARFAVSAAAPPDVSLPPAPMPHPDVTAEIELDPAVLGRSAHAPRTSPPEPVASGAAADRRGAASPAHGSLHRTTGSAEETTSRTDGGNASGRGRAKNGGHGDTRNGGLAGTREPGTAGTNDVGAGSTRDGLPGGTREPGAAGAKDRGAGGTKDRGAEATKDRRPGGTRQPGTTGTSDVGAGGTRERGPSGTKDGGAGGTKVRVPGDGGTTAGDGGDSSRRSGDEAADRPARAGHTGVVSGDFGWDESAPAPRPEEEPPPGGDGPWGVSSAGNRTDAHTGTHPDGRTGVHPDRHVGEPRDGRAGDPADDRAGSRAGGRREENNRR